MWVRLDDRIPWHPKFLKAGPVANWLYVAGLCYCNSYLTDGFIPAEQVPFLAPRLSKSEVEEASGALVEAGLWERQGADFLVHDYLRHNPSKAEVEESRVRDRERKARSRKPPQSKRTVPTESKRTVPTESKRARLGTVRSGEVGKVRSGSDNGDSLSDGQKGRVRSTGAEVVRVGAEWKDVSTGQFLWGSDLVVDVIDAESSGAA